MQQCFQELGKAIVHYMDLQGEIDEAKDKYKRLTADVLKIVQRKCSWLLSFQAILMPNILGKCIDSRE
jgi:hypothetical protein